MWGQKDAVWALHAIWRVPQKMQQEEQIDPMLQK